MNIEQVEISCCNCGVTFWITKNHDEELVNCGNSFYCPNGHRQHYTESIKAKLKKAMSKLKDAEAREAEERDSAEKCKRSNTALQGVITKMKKKEARKLNNGKG
jgi:hypothetical protein